MAVQPRARHSCRARRSPDLVGPDPRRGHVAGGTTHPAASATARGAVERQHRTAAPNDLLRLRAHRAVGLVDTSQERAQSGDVAGHSPWPGGRPAVHPSCGRALAHRSVVGSRSGEIRGGSSRASGVQPRSTTSSSQTSGWLRVQRMSVAQATSSPGRSAPSRAEPARSSPGWRGSRTG
jgi:hypothetical protein